MGITKVPIITELIKIIYCGHPQVMVVTVFAIAVTVVILLKLYITLGFQLGVLELYTGILTIALHQAIQYSYTVT